jgi:flagellar hook-associated protein 1 FlgK
MSDLLSIGKSGVLAYQSALAGISENVVNANNDGFARRQVTLSEQASAPGPMSLYRSSLSFNGVQAASVSRVWDQYTAQKAWSANSDNSQASTRSQFFSNVQDALNDGDSGVGVKLTAVFTAGSALAANPTDTTLRQSFIYALQDASGAITNTAASLTSVGSTVSSQAGIAVGQVNDALAALAKINLSLKTAPQGTSGRAALEDQRDTIIGTISDKLGIDVTLDTYGSATIKMNDSGGPTLLDGSSTIPGQLGLTVATNGTLSMTVTNGGTTSAVSPTSGALAGYAEAANQITGRRQQLDALAASLVQQVNGWNAQGSDLSGNPGGDLMSGTDAASLTVSVTDPSLIAAASADGTSPNGNLLALPNLRGATGVEATWKSLVNDQAIKVQSAQTQATSASTAKDAAYSALDDVSGVDLDTEAADLMHFQQAYSASAKIIQTARETLQAVLDLF